MSAWKYCTALALCVSTSTAAWAADTPQASLQFSAHKFQWRESGLAGERLLKEQGWRYSIGAAFDNFRSEGPQFLYSVSGKFYFGTVDYDGQTQSGTPATADVDYFGLNLEGLVGYRLGRRLGVDFFGGIGLDDWLRSISDGRTNTGQPVYGYDETYTIIYGKAGVGFYQLLKSWRYFLQAGVKMPLFTSEYVDLGSGVTLEPGIEPSAFANLQFDFGSGPHNRFSVALYYDSFRFDESDPEIVSDPSGVYLVYQPRSEMDVYGLRFGYYFF